MELILIAVACIIVSAAITWLLASARVKAIQAALVEKLSARDAENTRLTAENHAYTTQLTGARAQAVRAETQLAVERAATTEKLAALADAHTRLTAEFKALSADALARNNEQFLALARENFAQLQQASAGDLDKRQQAIESLVRPLRESLTAVDTKIATLEKTRAEAYGALGEQLKQLGTAQTRLQDETGRLSTALRGTSAAGTWGELQLRRVVELAGMADYCDFETQTSVSTEQGRLRPDLVVRLPGGQNIVVDAKAPNEAYREAAAAPDEATRVARLAEHAAKVRGHVDALSAKAYWEQFQPSPEFVVLFLPGDQFLAAALQGDPSLLERAITRRVLLATPASLIALLKAAAYGWRQEALSRNAEEISALGRQLYDRVATFAEHLEKVGKGLDAAARGLKVPFSPVPAASSSSAPKAPKTSPPFPPLRPRPVSSPAALEATLHSFHYPSQ
jgi:DNA recombination protein RmuC